MVNGKKRTMSKRKYCLNCSPFGKHNTRRIHLTKEKTDDNVTLAKNRENKKSFLVNVMGGECSICGYNKCLASLTFHHIVPSDKKYRVSGSVIGKNKESVIREVCKTVLICSNCHGEVHYGIHRDLVKEWTMGYETRKESLYQKIISIKNPPWFKVGGQRKNKIYKKCNYCDEKFVNNSKRIKCCSVKCANLMKRRIKNRPSKEKLEELKSIMSNEKIGIKYGVHESTIREWIKQYKIME